MLSDRLSRTFEDDVIRPFKQPAPFPVLLDQFDQYTPEGFGIVAAQSRSLGVFGLYRSLNGAFTKTDKKRVFMEIAANAGVGVMLDTYSDNEYLVCRNIIKTLN